MAQLVPFQLSASVTPTLELSMSAPTAIQAPAEWQEIPDRSLAVAPMGLGVDWIAQLVPFRLSASGSVGPEPIS
jgi:hypothetical protein